MFLRLHLWGSSGFLSLIPEYQIIGSPTLSVFADIVYLIMVLVSRRQEGLAVDSKHEVADVLGGTTVVRAFVDASALETPDPNLGCS